ncbi:AAA family ATPase [Planococcus sp. APC 4015]|nr:AAA family ATPase [Planococcus sp. APC 4015]
MRIVVSGTHASGKSTLIADFARRHRDFVILPDPFELMDAAPDEPDAGFFLSQLGIASARLEELSPDEQAIAERGPLDFLAYLEALDVLGRSTRGPELFRRSAELAARAGSQVDLLVLLPLAADSGIRVPEDEDLELRDAMNDALLELADDPDLTGGAVIVEIAGDPDTRLARLEEAVAAVV